MMRTNVRVASLRRRVATCCAALLLTRPVIALAEVLPALGADTQSVTVSGVSSGGYMAVQFHIAHSLTVDGAGVLAGGPYGCAAGSTWHALTRCMSPSIWNPLPPAEVFRQRTLSRAQAGDIDSLHGLAGDRAWIFSGGLDETVRWPVVDSLNRFYRAWLPFGQTLFVTHPNAGHAMISTEEPEPNTCASSKPPFINRCGSFDAAGELLAHLLGPLAPKQEPPAERIRPFDQRPFLDRNVAASGMADQGYVFFPESCESGGCRVHVAFHGCRQTARQIGLRFVENAGYIEWAQSNRLIVLFPQIVPQYGWTGSLSWVFNPRGCWDWWGYTDSEYATRKGLQIKAVKGMIERLGEFDAPMQ
jgi:poly(3-hydroxybutyrate) depolymerase